MTGAPMQRREFITLLGGAAAAWPIAARAQQATRLPTIGYLSATTPVNDAANSTVFTQRLRELGWTEGRNIAFERRWAEGSPERAAGLIAEFVRLKVDVILTGGNLYALTAKRATAAIPIVFAIAGDPVGTGLVASLARPGSNLTGLSNQLIDAAGKRVELLREVLPTLRRLALMTISSAQSALEVGEIETAARKLGLEIARFEIETVQDIGSAFETIKDRADALYVINSAFLATNKTHITFSALGARLPTMFSNRSWLEAGGLMSYGTNLSDLWRRSADYVDKILRGTKPADIPVEQPTKFDLVVNLISARAIGLAIPETFLVRATEVIE
jgi:putative ABC transport system substrate-binding protein